MGRTLKYQITGWVLFISGCIFYIISSILNGDFIGLIASVLFLIACIFFLTSLLMEYKKP